MLASRRQNCVTSLIMKDYDGEDDIGEDYDDDDDDQMLGRRNCVTSLSRDNTTSRNEYKVTTLTMTISKVRENIDSKDCFDLVARIAKTCQPCQPVGAIFSGRC